MSDHVTINLVLDSSGPARAGFGVGAILSVNASWPERSRTYSGIAEVADDWDEDSPEYLAAQVYFSQEPRPETLKIIRGANKPTLVYELDALTTNASYAYKMNVKGEGVTSTEVSYTSDSVPTQAEIHNGIRTALNAVTGKNYTCAFEPLVNADDVFTAEADTELFTAVAHGLLTGDGPFQVSNSGGALPTGLVAATDYWIIRVDADNFQLATSLANALAGTNLSITDDGTGTQTISDTVSTVRPSDPLTITGTAAGDWFSIEPLNSAGHDSRDDWSLEITSTDPGTAADLTAIAIADPEWYQLYLLYPSDAITKAAAAWCEARAYTMIAASYDTIACTVAADGTQGTLDDLKTLGYKRTMGMYHHAPDQFAHVAWGGAVLPTDPGGIVYAYKPLAGVSFTHLTSTERTNLDNRNAGYYKKETEDTFFTWKGKSAQGQFFDITRDLDWYQDELAKNILGLFVSSPKVPFTKPGTAQIQAKVRESTELGVRRGVFDGEPEPEYLFVDPDDVSSNDRANRHYPDNRVTVQLAGAVLTVQMNISIQQ